MVKKISDIIAETRSSKGISRSEMARQLGIGSQLLGKYEDGKVLPKVDFRLNFEKLYGVSLLIDNKSSTRETVVFKDNSAKHAKTQETNEKIIDNQLDKNGNNDIDLPPDLTKQDGYTQMELYLARTLQDYAAAEKERAIADKERAIADRMREENRMRELDLILSGESKKVRGA